MEDRVQRARQRFKDMLASAEAAADRAAQERPMGRQLSSSMLSAMKFMNRAGGFLEAISIVHPELGAELIDEFEAFAAKIEVVEARHGEGERRGAPLRRARSDRRGWDRRLNGDRRRSTAVVTTERRLVADRRTEDRRTGKIRELADRRLSSLHH